MIRRGVPAFVLAVIGGGVAVAVAPDAHAAGAVLTATFSQTSTYSSGYNADYVIANSGDAAATSWTVAFDLPAGTTVKSSWSSKQTTSGNHYTFTNESYDGTIKAGKSVDFGFNTTGFGVPADCTLNGASCSGGSRPTSSPPSPTKTSSPTPSPIQTTSAPPIGDVINVSTAAQLSSAIASVKAGQTIRLAAGTYSGAFIAQTAGTAAKPITLTGPATAILTNPDSSGTAPSDGCAAPVSGYDPGYGLWLYQSAYWKLSGFTVASAKKGIILDNSAHVTIDGVYVHDIGAEGVHFRSSSPDGILQNSRIEKTGTVQPEFGEGIYLGSANSNWKCYGNTGGVDASNNVQVLNNHVGPNVAAEHVDVKEGTTGGVIRGNTFNGQGIAGQNSADSWLDVKGTGYTIENNTGTFSSPGTFANGYETHNPTSGSGCGNVWRNNRSDLGGVGAYAIDITSTSKCKDNPNIVYASNTVTNAKTGLTNIAVTP